MIDILLLNQRKDVSVKWRVLYYLLKSKLGVLYLTSQMTGKPVKRGNLLVNRWSGKSLQFPALATTDLNLAQEMTRVLGQFCWKANIETPIQHIVSGVAFIFEHISHGG